MAFFLNRVEANPNKKNAQFSKEVRLTKGQTEIRSCTHFVSDCERKCMSPDREG